LVFGNKFTVKDENNNERFTAKGFSVKIGVYDVNGKLIATLRAGAGMLQGKHYNIEIDGKVVCEISRKTKAIGMGVNIILSWGFGMIEVSDDEVKANIPTFDTTPNYRASVTNDVGTGSFDENNRINEYEATIYKSVYDYFKLPYDISFDDFNSRFGGFTRQQYIDLLKEKNALKH